MSGPRHIQNKNVPAYDINVSKQLHKCQTFRLLNSKTVAAHTHQIEAAKCAAQESENQMDKTKNIIIGNIL